MVLCYVHSTTKVYNGATWEEKNKFNFATPAQLQPLITRYSEGGKDKSFYNLSFVGKFANKSVKQMYGDA